MLLRNRLRLFVFGSLSLVALGGAVVAACNDDTSVPGGSGDGGGGGKDSTTTDEDGSTTTDSSTDAPTTDGGTDAAKDAKTRDANGPGEAGTECAFNYECQLALRCDCDVAFPCECTPGARGTGRNGLDVCDSGNNCVSSVCVEGPGDSGTSYCSDECVDDSDCTGKLPQCTTISFVGRICIRKP